jgi:hypothetical protein
LCILLHRFKYKQHNSLPQPTLDLLQNQDVPSPHSPFFWHNNCLTIFRKCDEKRSRGSVRFDDSKGVTKLKQLTLSSTSVTT